MQFVKLRNFEIALHIFEIIKCAPILKWNLYVLRMTASMQVVGFSRQLGNPFKFCCDHRVC